MQLKADFPEDLRVVYRHFPLASIHNKAILSAQAAEAAGLQGKFFEMHDLLYQQQGQWSSLSVDAFQDWAVEQAGLLGLDTAQFEQDMLSDEIRTKAENAWTEGQEVGIPGTPFILINGTIYDGPRDYWNLSTIIKLLGLEARQYETCPDMVIDPAKQYTAIVETENGQIVLDLFADAAPLAVNNFVFLAREGWYDGITFHRVLEGFMAQAGDPSGTGFGGPGYAFVNETAPDLTFDREGLLAMANAGPDTNGSQFFITFGPTEQLNGGYTIFGEVREGMDVVNQISFRNPGQGVNLPPGDRIISVTIEEN
jgi:cyclophilin family peptidyl-prolyl cis-trans isomerase